MAVVFEEEEEEGKPARIEGASIESVMSVQFAIGPRRARPSPAEMGVPMPEQMSLNVGKGGLCCARHNARIREFGNREGHHTHRDCAAQVEPSRKWPLLFCWSDSGLSRSKAEANQLHSNKLNL